MNDLGKRLLRTFRPQRWPNGDVTLRAPPVERSAWPIAFPGSEGGPFKPLEKLVDAYDAPVPGPAVLSFGDSVHLRASNDDANPTPLWQMLEAGLSQFGGCLAIAHSALNIHLYDDLSRVLETSRSRPRVMLVPVNLRSFSPQWYCNPAWRFEAVRPLVAAVARDRSKPLGPVADVLETPGFYDAYLATAVAYPFVPHGTIGEFQAVVRQPVADEAAARERLRTIMIYHYNHPLLDDHPLLGSLADLLERMRRLAIAPVLYLTPVNRGLGRDLVGPDFGRTVDANIRLITAVAEKHGGKLNDLSDRLGPEHFFHVGSPTEHLRETGRVELNAALAEQVRQFS